MRSDVMARECAIIPDNFKTGITGAELLRVGIQCAEDAGFKWPEDWQFKSYEDTPWNNKELNGLDGRYQYRINPERLKAMDLNGLWDRALKAGMERAAEIANTQCTETNECPVWKQIRAELEKTK